MDRGLLLKAVALVVFLGGLGGATYGTAMYLGDEAALTVVAAEGAPTRTILNATAGHAVTYPVTVVNLAKEAATLRVRAVGEGIDATTGNLSVPARGNTTAFLTVDVPADAAPGERRLTIAVVTPAGREVDEVGEVTLRVLGPATGFGEGDTASVRYTGRLVSTGKLFDTNDPFVNALNVPATERFRPHGSAPLQVEFDAPRVIEGFFEGLVGMQPGESRTVTFPAEKGYGPLYVPREVDREERLERGYELEIKTDVVNRTTFDGYVEETEQGEGPWEVGDVFRYDDGVNKWPYEITSIDATEVEYTLHVEVGERYTLYTFWKEASEVVAINATHAIFRTTPPGAVGDAFTMRDYWPNMTAVREVTEDEIVVRHSPPVGFKFSQGQSRVGPPQEGVVQEVREDVIVVGIKSTDALAGEALTFDVELLALTR